MQGTVSTRAVRKALACASVDGASSAAAPAAHTTVAGVREHPYVSVRPWVSLTCARMNACVRARVHARARRKRA